MIFEESNIDVVRNVVAKFQNSHRIIWSNYFALSKCIACKYYMTSKTILIIKQEYYFYRLYILSADYIDMITILKKLPHGEYVLNIPHKGSIVDINAEIIYKAGFNLIGEYHRFYNKAIVEGNEYLSLYESLPNNNIAQWAEKSDSSQLWSLLSKTFSLYTDYIPTKEELELMILNKQVFVNRDDNHNIIGTIIFSPKGKSCYQNAWIGDSQYGVYLMKRLYQYFIENNITHTNFWIRKNNKPVMKLHMNLGAVPDGLVDYTFFKKI